MTPQRIAEIRGYYNRVMPVPGPWGEGWGKYLGELLDEVERLQEAEEDALSKTRKIERMQDVLSQLQETGIIIPRSRLTVMEAPDASDSP